MVSQTHAGPGCARAAAAGSSFQALRVRGHRAAPSRVPIQGDAADCT